MFNKSITNFIVILVSSIVCADIAATLTALLPNETPSKAAERLGHQLVSLDGNTVFDAAAMLTRYGVPFAHVGGWNQHVGDFLVHANGAVTEMENSHYYPKHTITQAAAPAGLTRSLLSAASPVAGTLGRSFLSAAPPASSVSFDDALQSLSKLAAGASYTWGEPEEAEEIFTARNRRRPSKLGALASTYRRRDPLEETFAARSDAAAKQTRRYAILPPATTVDLEEVMLEALRAATPVSAAKKSQNAPSSLTETLRRALASDGAFRAAQEIEEEEIEEDEAPEGFGAAAAALSVRELLPYVPELVKLVTSALKEEPTKQVVTPAAASRIVRETTLRPIRSR